MDDHIDMSLDDIIKINKSKNTKPKRGGGSAILAQFKNNKANNSNGTSPLNRSTNTMWGGRGRFNRNTRGGYRAGSQRGALQQGGIQRLTFNVNNTRNSTNYSQNNNNNNKIKIVRNWNNNYTPKYNISRSRKDRIIGVSRKNSQNIVIFTQRQLAKKVMQLARKIAAKKLNVQQPNTAKRRGKGQNILNNYKNTKAQQQRQQQQQQRAKQFDDNGILQINIPTTNQDDPDVKVMLAGKPRKNRYRQQNNVQNNNNYQLPEDLGIPNTTGLSLSDRFAAGRNNAVNGRNIYY